MPDAARVILIGRGADCDLVLDDDAVSRRHAELRLEPTGWTIVDLQSSNGTFVTRDGREQRYDRLAVTAFDTLRFGTVKTTLPEIFRQVGILKDEPQPPSAGSSAPASHASPQAAPQPSADTSGRRRTVRCQCGAPKKEGSPCPVCGA